MTQGGADDSSQTNLCLEFWIINLRLGFGVGVLGFWACDKSWGRVVTDSTQGHWLQNRLDLYLFQTV